MTSVTAARAGLACVALGYVVGAAAAVDARPWPFAVAVIVALGGEVLLHQSGPDAPPPASSAWTGGLPVRTVGRDVLLVVLVGACARVSASGSTGDSRAVLGTVVSGLLALTVLRVAGSVDEDLRRRRVAPVAWRNLDLPGVHTSPRRLPAGLADAAWTDVGLHVVVYAGAVVWCAGWSVAVVYVAVSGAVLLGVGLIALRALDLVRRRRDTPIPAVIAELSEALRGHAPSVVFYFSRPDEPAAAAYMADVWVPALERLGPRVLVLVREPEHFRALHAGRLPVVLVVRSVDLEKVVPGSVRLALYPGNTRKNNHVVRLPGIVDVFIGYGDSDKPESTAPVTRVFDQVWVSGSAARERLRAANVGVRDDQIREIGRPTVGPPSTIRRRDPADPAAGALTVLYAPTREAFPGELNHSSVLTMAAAILHALRQVPNVRVVFRPHPGSGVYDPAVRVEADRLTSAAADPTSRSLSEEFAAADVLVTDVSALITDFLATGKPYVVTNPNGWADDEFRARFPSVGAAYLLGPDVSGLRGVLETVRPGLRQGDDPLAGARARLAPYLLGTGDPSQLFAAAVDDVLREPPRG